MKKIALILFISMLFITNVSALDNEKCFYPKIDELKESLKDVTFNYTVLPKDTVVEDDYTLENTDVSYKIKVEVSNLPDNYYALLVSGDYMKRIDNSTPIITTGGVYTVEFYNRECGLDIIKEYEIMIPHYSVENKNVWFDGTYEQTASSYEDKNSSKVSIKLVLVLSSLIIIIVTFVIIIFVRKRQKL